VVRERFRREIVVARRIVHAGVCRVFDLHEEEGAYAISMALIEGRSCSRAAGGETPDTRAPVRSCARCARRWRRPTRPV